MLRSGETMLNLGQALELAALVPSVFITMLLVGICFKNRQAITVAFYFVVLACGFALPILPLLPSFAHEAWFESALTFGDSLLIAFCFLIVIQFTTGHVPKPMFWGVLIIPLAGALLLYASYIQEGDSCLVEHTCQNAGAIRQVYGIISSGFILLLAILYAARARYQGTPEDKRHKYWLILSLIILHVALIAIALAAVAGRLLPAESELLGTVMRLSFIYLMLTSLIRVFSPKLNQPIYITARAALRDPAIDQPYIKQIHLLFAEQKLYREMRLNRAALAEKLKISESNLSRIINSHFSQSFNELINGYRIEEAKARLLAEPETQITVIGFEVGFNSIASFNRVFKLLSGMSPSEWREKNKN